MEAKRQWKRDKEAEFDTDERLYRSADGEFQIRGVYNHGYGRGYGPMSGWEWYIEPTFLPEEEQRSTSSPFNDFFETLREAKAHAETTRWAAHVEWTRRFLAGEKPTTIQDIEAEWAAKEVMAR